MKNKIISIISAIFIASSIFGVIPSYAENICDNSGVTNEVKAAAGCNGSNDNFQKIITNILNVIIGSSAIVSVIFIVIGGINYMTSSGDATKVKKAKDTILYAVIGLIVCALAFAIVNWVIGTLLGQGNTTSQTP